MNVNLASLDLGEEDNDAFGVVLSRKDAFRMNTNLVCEVLC